MNAFQVSLKKVHESMDDVNTMLAKLNAKAGITADTHEEIHFTASNRKGIAGPPDQSMWDQSSFAIDDEDEKEINIKASHLNRTFNSNAMDSAAGEK